MPKKPVPKHTGPAPDFSEGREVRAWKSFGSHLTEENGVAGCRFQVWAPNAESVCVMGDFNNWDDSDHSLLPLGDGICRPLRLPRGDPPRHRHQDLRDLGL